MVGLEDIATGAIGGLIGMGLQAGQDERQIRQQKKLQELQMQGGKEMADYNQKKQQENWDNTNYEAQKKHMIAAGLNPGLMYGGGGGGGTTMGSGGGAMPSSATPGDPNAGSQNIMQMALLLSQQNLMVAQTKKTEADTTKTVADTGKTTEETKGVKFTNDLNNLIGKEEMWQRYKTVTDKLQVSQQKEMGEWNAWQAAAFEGKPTDDPNSPIAKAYRAGFKQTLIELETAKANGDVKRAEAEIKEFEAGLAHEGIPPNSPWGVKIIADLLEKIGLGITPGVIKGAQVVKDTVNKFKQ